MQLGSVDGNAITSEISNRLVAIIMLKNIILHSTVCKRKQGGYFHFYNQIIIYQQFEKINLLPDYGILVIKKMH